jgi:transcriptional regulator with XRE-family HTH domain
MAIDSEEIFTALPEATRKAIEARTDELIAEELTLAAIREARRRSREAIAKKLGVQQPTVSKIERQTDMYLSTLRSYIAALGGELRIVALFPDRSPAYITNFKPLRRKRPADPTLDGDVVSTGSTDPLSQDDATVPARGGGGKTNGEKPSTTSGEIRGAGKVKEDVNSLTEGHTLRPAKGNGQAKEVET